MTSMSLGKLNKDSRCQVRSLGRLLSSARGACPSDPNTFSQRERGAEISCMPRIVVVRRNERRQTLLHRRVVTLAE